MNNVERGKMPELFEYVLVTTCVSNNRKHRQDSENCPVLIGQLKIINLQLFPIL